jgi:hypothetical protein
MDGHSMFSPLLSSLAYLWWIAKSVGRTGLANRSKVRVIHYPLLQLLVQEKGT